VKRPLEIAKKWRKIHAQKIKNKMSRNGQTNLGHNVITRGRKEPTIEKLALRHKIDVACNIIWYTGKYLYIFVL